MIEVSRAGSEDNVLHSRLSRVLKRAVALYRHAFIGAVIAHDAHVSVVQFIAILFVNPAFYQLYHLRIFKGKDVVIAPAVASA